MSSTVLGCVKWFNAKAGYGFVTDKDLGRDVFVHHSGLKVTKEQFRYLVEGEYVEMKVTEEGGRYTGTEVTGVRGGKLMCETRVDGVKSEGSVKKDGGVKREKRELKYKPKAEL
jgi:CspA family cold shock protein